MPRDRTRRKLLADSKGRLTRPARERRWLDENRQAIASINEFVDRRGLLSARLRYRSIPGARAC